MTFHTLLALILVLSFSSGLSSAATESQARTTDPDRPLWMRYPAISPDGTRIAFAYRGQIWIVPSQGGEATALTGAPFYSSHPIWSPDGKRIAFTSDRHGNADVFIVPVDGGPATRLTYHSASDRPMAFSRNGEQVFFDSNRLGDPVADAFDAQKGLGAPIIRQVYAVPSSGGRPHLVSATPMLDLSPGRDGKQMLYTSFGSIENPWRKHQVSDSAGDIWLYDTAPKGNSAGKHRRLTQWRGEDRNALFMPDQAAMVWLSERGGSFNVWRRALDGGEPEQVTHHTQWPVRFLSSADDGTLAYAWDGEIWILPQGKGEPRRVPVQIRQTDLVDGPAVTSVNDSATELSVSPDGKELAVIARGEVFVVSTADGATRRITRTPAEERFVSFSQDGRKLLYASERGGDWDIYESRLTRDADTGFSGAAPFEEALLLDSDSDSYQPLYSPVGDKIAYVDNRSTIRVLDTTTGDSVEVLPTDVAYSYQDGDMQFAWSPDGRWLVARTGMAGSNVELLDATGRMPRQDLTLNGFSDNDPSVSADGSLVLWISDRNGLRTAISQGVQKDVYAAFLTREAFEAFKSGGEKTPPEDAAAKLDVSTPANGAGLPEVAGLDLRTVRLTPFSTPVAFYRLTPDGKKLVFVSLQADGTAAGTLLDLKTKVSKQLFTRPAGADDSYVTDPKVESLFVLSNGAISRYGLGDGKKTPVPFKAEMVRDVHAEVASIFDHSWRATRETFYRPDMQGVDWDAVGAHYRRFVPLIVHWENLSELLSEMQGELNASHQGTHFQRKNPLGDQTASLGLYYDQSYEGEGVRIAEVIPGGAADHRDSPLVPGAVILSVDGIPIQADMSIDQLLNRRAGKPVLLSVKPADGGPEVSETLKPVNLLEENALAYRRWVAKRREMVERLSQGRIGYVHISGMALAQYQQAYGELFGRYRDADGVIVDIRFNGGGNLHDQLVVMLTGENDSDLISRDGNTIIRNPVGRFTKPSVLLVNASSYSDASVFPMLYQVKRIGKIVGERVPGTGTARSVVSELQPGLTYTVPELGFRLKDGNWFENTEVEPEVLIYNDPDSVAAGHDRQLKQAVEELLGSLPAPMQDKDKDERTNTVR